MDIINYFLDNPGKKYHIRGLARLAKKSPTTISTKLNELKKEGYVTSTKEIGHVFYRADIENSIYKDFKLYYNIKRIRSSGLLEFLKDHYNYHSAIILFGSFRKSENISASDIDLCAITAKKSEPNLIVFEKKLKHPIQLFTFSKEEFKSLKKKNPELLNNLINGIVLEGYLEVF